MNETLKHMIEDRAQQRDYRRSEKGKREAEAAKLKRLVDIKRLALWELKQRVVKMTAHIDQMAEAYLMNMGKLHTEGGFAHALAMQVIVQQRLDAKQELMIINERIAELQQFVERNGGIE